MTFGAPCQASFNTRVQANGTLNTYNTQVTCPNGHGGYFNVEECDPSWPGQITLPDTDPAQVNLDICLRHGGYPQGQNGVMVNHNITYTINDTPRYWDQASTDTVTDNHPTEGPFPAISSSWFTDQTTPDNITIIEN